MKRLFPLLILITILFTLTGCKTISEQVGSADSPQQVASLVQEHGYFDLTCRDAAGQIKWQESDVPNALANEGEYVILDTMMRGNTAPTQYYLRGDRQLPGAGDYCGHQRGKRGGCSGVVICRAIYLCRGRQGTTVR